MYNIEILSFGIELHCLERRRGQFSFQYYNDAMTPSSALTLMWSAQSSQIIIMLKPSSPFKPDEPGFIPTMRFFWYDWDKFSFGGGLQSLRVMTS